MTSDELLTKILNFCSRHKISPTEFSVAAGNRALVTRLKSGADVTLATANRALAFMRDYRK